MEQVESVLTLVISLLGAVTALLTALEHLRRPHPHEEEVTLAELEQDIVRLENALRQQQAAISRLQPSDQP